MFLAILSILLISFLFAEWKGFVIVLLTTLYFEAWHWLMYGKSMSNADY